ncbi:MAG: glycosyltransferase family 4 protein [Thermodesulfobacteriota bacterium]
MKLALVQPKFDRSGGAERYAWNLARGLAARGHEVHLFARRAEDLPGAVRWHPVPALPLGRALKTWTFGEAAGRRVGRHRFDVVQGFGKTTFQTVHRAGGGVHRAYLERKGSPRPTFYDRTVLAIEDRLFSSPVLRAVVAPSRWVAGEIARFYPGVEGRLRVIPNGVDVEHFRPEGREADRRALETRLGLSAESRILLLVATNFALKGLGEAVAALPHLPGAHLAVAGGDDPRPFREQAAALGVGERLHFLGPAGDPAPFYRAADALVHPTRYDPFANVCLEALACGTPVVTTSGDGAADVAAGSGAGVVLGLPVAAGELAAAVKDLLAQEGVHRAARETAERHEQGRHVAAVEALYREVAE